MATVKTIAMRFNVSADTIRHYTKIGLLVPIRDGENGYRHYTERDARRLRFLLSAKRLGFSLKEIQQILDMADSGTAPCSLVRELIDDHLKTTRREMLDTKILYERMEHAARLWEQMPSKVPSGDSVCHLIECWEEPVTVEDVGPHH